MNDIVLSSATIGVVISLLAYQLGVFLKIKTKKSIFNPLLISIALVIVVLLVFDIEYESYNQSAKYLSYLLTPATVSLAIPLYQQLDLLKKNVTAVIIGITSGVLTSLLSVLLLSMLFRLTHAEYVTTKALELGQIEGAMSSLSIVVAGLMTVVLASFFAMMY